MLCHLYFYMNNYIWGFCYENDINKAIFLLYPYLFSFTCLSKKNIPFWTCQHLQQARNPKEMGKLKKIYSKSMHSNFYLSMLQ